MGFKSFGALAARIADRVAPAPTPEPAERNVCDLIEEAVLILLDRGVDPANVAPILPAVAREAIAAFEVA
jgi:hypothetical protein